MINDGVLVSRRWLERVNLALFGSSEMPKDAVIDGGSRFYDVRPVSLRGSWSFAYDAGQEVYGTWSNTACFIVNNRLQTSFTFPIYYPANIRSATPPTKQGDNRFAVWRGRWELIAEPTIKYPTYGGGTGIAVAGAPSGSNYNYIVDNTGLIKAVVNDANGEANPTRGTLYFNGLQFKRDFNIVETVGKWGVSIRTQKQTVVTDVAINNGQLDVTTKQIDIIAQ